MNYVNGHGVSKNAERIIKIMLTQTIAISQYDKETDADEEKDETNVEEELQPLKLSETNFKDIIRCSKISVASEQWWKKSLRNTLAKSMYQKEYAKAQQSLELQ